MIETLSDSSILDMRNEFCLQPMLSYLKDLLMKISWLHQLGGGRINLSLKMRVVRGDCLPFLLP